MHNGHTVVDVDAHYVEAIEDLAAYMDEPWRTRILEGQSNAANVFFPSGSGSRDLWGKIQREHTNYPNEPTSPEEIPEIMEFLGVDKTVLISHMVLLASHIEADDTRATTFSTAYIDYMLDNVIDPEEGIYGAIPLPYQDPPEAAEFIDEVGSEPGLVTGCVINSGAEPPLGNRQYDVMYQAAVDADLPVIFHTGGSNLDDYHRKGFGKFMETHVLGFLESNMAQLTSLVVQGVPEKFPDLDIVFMESGVFWVPMLMARLDEEYLKRTEEAPLLTKRPSEYIKDIYFGTQPFEKSTEEKYLRQAIEMMDGPNTLMYASDYPHWDFDRPTAISELAFLTDEEKARILGGNAEEVFGI